MVGKLQILSYPLITKKVVLVSLNGSTLPDASGLQTELNKIFGQGVARVEVSTTNFATTVYDGSIDAERTHYKYSDEMKAIVSAFKKTTAYTSDANTAYLFLGNSSTSGLEGVMNRGYQFGFIFNVNANVIAHELGHGLFALEHTENDNSLEKAVGDLMGGSSTGTGKLYKYQWVQMQNPPSVWGMMESGDDGEFGVPVLAPNGKVFKSKSNTFLSHNGQRSTYFASVKQTLNGGIFGYYENGKELVWNGSTYKSVTSWAAQDPVWGSEQLSITSFTATEANSPYYAFTYQPNGDCAVELRNSNSSSNKWQYPGCTNGVAGAPKQPDTAPAVCSPLPSPLTVENLISKNAQSMPLNCLVPITLEQRIALLKTLLAGTVTDCITGNCYEPLTRALVLSTPPSQEKGMLDGLRDQNLLEPIFEKLQLGTFDEVVNKLSAWVTQYYPKPTTLSIKAILDEKSTSGIAYLENRVTSDFSNNKIKLTREAYGFCKECTTVPEVSINADPYSYVYINLKSNLGNYASGQKVLVPAMYAALLFNKDRRDLYISTGKIALDGVLFVVGVGEFSAAYDAYRTTKTALTLYRATKAGLDLGFAVSDILINNTLENSLTEEQLATWNKINFLYSIGSISAAAIEGVAVKYGSTIDNATEFQKVADELLDGVSAGRKAILLTKFKDFANIKSWINGLDDIVDANLLSKLDNLEAGYFSKFDADLAHSTYGPEIKALLKESPDDLADIWKRLKDDPAYSWEIQKTGGSRWEKWGQREFFKDITAKGKGFETNVCLAAFKNRTSVSYLELKQKFQTDFRKNLDDYDMYSQVQLKYDGDNYFVADQLFVKRNALGDIDDLVVIENKLSSSTPLTAPQSTAFTKTSFTVRSVNIESSTKPGQFLKGGDGLMFGGAKQWYKVHDGANGDLISGINKMN